MRYIKGFDTIRALAVFLVIIDRFHWGALFPPGTMSRLVAETVVPSGRFGVNLFFVLSGFLITSILLHEKIYHADKPFTVIKNFFIRRVLRIFPIYYLVIFLCWIFNYQFVREYIWYFLTYTSNFLPYSMNKPNVLSHTWSLAVEEQFYLIWPWLIIFVNRKYLKYVFLGAIITGIVSKYMVLYVYHHDYPVLAINCLDSFGVGGWYAYIRLDKNKTRIFDRKFGMLFAFMLFIAWRASPFGGNPVLVMYARFLNSVIAVALIMFVLNNQSDRIRKYVLENKVLNFIGKISYGIYLYHYTLGPSYNNFITGFTARHPGLSPVVNNFYISYCSRLAILIFISWLSYIIIEQPILRLKKYFHYTS